MEKLIREYENMDVQLLFRVVIEEFKDDTTRLNKAQLMKGERADGTQLPAYSTAYARRKRKPVKPKTLNDTGAFHDGFDILYLKEYMELFSRDSKDKFIPDVHGDQIYGITEKSKQDLLPQVKNKLVEYILARK